MRTIERNYRKNPHTANFLMTFHTGGQGLPADAIRDDSAALAAEAAQDDDLLALVPDAPADLRTPGQVGFMDDLIGRITRLDGELGAAARKWTDDATAAGHWTPGRGGNASAWIDRMIQKEGELKAGQAKPVAAMPTVADGRYAVEEGGTLKFFKVKNGNRPGFVFLDVQASDDWHGVRNLGRIREVLALIAVDAEAASLRYGRELGVCGDCGRTLTDETSRARGRGPICDARH